MARNLWNSCGICCVCTLPFLCFIGAVFVLHRHLQGLPLLSTATCTLVETLPKEKYVIQVTPLKLSSRPFNTTESIEKKGLRYFLRKEKNVTCFWKEVDCMSYPGAGLYYCRKFVQFHGNRTERNAGFLTWLSIVIIVTLLMIFLLSAAILEESIKCFNRATIRN